MSFSAFFHWQAMSEHYRCSSPRRWSKVKAEEAETVTDDVTRRIWASAVKPVLNAPEVLRKQLHSPEIAPGAGRR